MKILGADWLSGYDHFLNIYITLQCFKVCLQSKCSTDRTCTEICVEPFYICSCLNWRDGMFCENFNVGKSMSIQIRSRTSPDKE